MSKSQRPGADEWRQIIDGQQRSGLTVSAYCLERGITQEVHSTRENGGWLFRQRTSISKDPIYSEAILRAPLLAGLAVTEWDSEADGIDVQVRQRTNRPGGALWQGCKFKCASELNRLTFRSDRRMLAP
ncbi:MAG: hypothetical protein ABSB35_05630 [Bryobacteraceae bacterium]|jgi:hypothetical protein